jgi:putative membrane protein
MTAGQILTSTWSWDPSVLVGCVALLGLYFFAGRGLTTTRHKIFFSSGVLVLFLALESPLEELGDTYLFSAHMLQHLLLILIVPPLLLWGLSRSLTQRILVWPWANRVEQILRRPLVAWPVAMVTLWLWHLPVLYNATLLNENIHIGEHLMFLVTATIFWWPVLNPLQEKRLAPLTTIFYLFAAAASSSALGIILTFAQPGLYPAYLQPEDALGILPLLRQTWGLTPAVDQQLGGLLMWVPGSLVYLSGILGALGRWYSEPEPETEGELAGSNPQQRNQLFA